MDVVDVAVTPSEEMTWEMWRYALLGIGSFTQNREYVELSFDVVVLGSGRVWTGRVFQEDTAELDGWLGLPWIMCFGFSAMSAMLLLSFS